ncbi:MAG: hypothetical protein H7831_03345 [Magnetococcus sp. WYHC-3]
MIELVMVLVILGALSSVVYAKWPDAPQSEAMTGTLMDRLRRAQYLTMVTRTIHYVDWDPLVQRLSMGDYNTSEEYFSETFDGASMEITTAFPIYFDALGRPYHRMPDGTFTRGGSNITTVTAQGSRKTLQVVNQTGAVINVD